MRRDFPFEVAVSGLRRKAVTTCSKWARTYRYTKDGPWSYRDYPWTPFMMDLDCDWVGMKAAQMGFTEVCLNRALYSMDILRLSVLYILPSKTPDATDFSADRFDSALELSPHLADMFSDVKNVGHKRAGSVSLYIRGARSRSGLKSIPAPVIGWDEFDEMSRAAVILGEERSSGQPKTQDFRISTPTIPNKLIDAEYKASSQRVLAYKCPHCNTFQTLEHDNCLMITGNSVTDPNLLNSYIHCPNCKTPIPHNRKYEYFNENNIEWVKGRTSFIKEGFRIPQHYSLRLPPWKIAKLTLQAESDPACEAELYNSKFGLPRVLKGHHVDAEMVGACLWHEMRNMEYPPVEFDFVTMGIDVGNFFHIVLDAVRVRDWDGTPENISACTQTFRFGVTKVESEKELIDTINTFRPIKFVIDANPEHRLAKRLVANYPKIGHRCFYANNPKEPFSEGHVDALQAGRSYWLDITQNNFREPRKRLFLPINLDQEYTDNVGAVVKHYRINKTTMEREVTFLSTTDDHYMHASAYSEMAKRLALMNVAAPNESMSEGV